MDSVKDVGWPCRNGRKIFDADDKKNPRCFLPSLSFVVDCNRDLGSVFSGFNSCEDFNTDSFFNYRRDSNGNYFKFDVERF